MIDFDVLADMEEEFKICELAKSPDIIASANLLFLEANTRPSQYTIQYAIAVERERCAKIAETCAGEYCADPQVCCSSEIAAKIRSGE
jgi:hypothetical protein